MTNNKNEKAMVYTLVSERSALNELHDLAELIETQIPSCIADINFNNYIHNDEIFFYRIQVLLNKLNRYGALSNKHNIKRFIRCIDKRSARCKKKLDELSERQEADNRDLKTELIEQFRKLHFLLNQRVKVYLMKYQFYNYQREKEANRIDDLRNRFYFFHDYLLKMLLIINAGGVVALLTYLTSNPTDYEGFIAKIAMSLFLSGLTVTFLNLIIYTVIIYIGNNNLINKIEAYRDIGSVAKKNSLRKEKQKWKRIETISDWFIIPFYIIAILTTLCGISGGFFYLVL